MGEQQTVAIVGAGIIGLATGYRLVQHGYQVTIYDPAPLSGASFYAGGMLAPLSEGWMGEEELLEWGVASLQNWPQLLTQWQEYSSTPLVTSHGSLLIAADSADAHNLQRIGRWLQENSHPSEQLRTPEITALVPGISSLLNFGIHLKEELTVDNRSVCLAAHRACEWSGVGFIKHIVDDLNSLKEDHIIVTTGVHLPTLIPDVKVRPVKGEILRLQATTKTLPPPSLTIRGHLHGRVVYLIPRHDGVVIGASEYEDGYSKMPAVGGVIDLLTDATEIMPGLRDYHLHEVSACLRPVSPDNVPWIGRITDRVIAAGGHGRNGFLLAAITAELMSTIVTNPKVGRYELTDLQKVLSP